MKFRFKIQQYQTDAVNSVVRVFQGQPKVEAQSYRRDIGEQPIPIQPAEEQLSFLLLYLVPFGDLRERIHRICYKNL